MMHNRLKLLIITGMILLGAFPARALQADHELRITIDPTTGRLDGFDRIRVRPEGARNLLFFLSPNAQDLQVDIDGRKVPFGFSGSDLRLDLPVAKPEDSVTVGLRYTAVFNDEAPVMPVNTDNPGYGVTGTISGRGTLLLPGAGWYPHIDADRTGYRVRVEAPPGIIAVTAGRSLGVESANGKTVSLWQVDHPVRGLAISAGPYRVRERKVGKVTAATYFLPESRHLEDQYLDATERYLNFYQERFGPYPFDKFAVVENFFPTGYGFSSYTLLGGRVLRLPFIIRTSLGHEIAHCWWGNGVYVDYRGGNWSEGLTTYVADYLYQEQESAQAAREYRRQWLRNYASLVTPQNDFPLDRFQSRYDPVTKTIGYDKAAMVFHMLRRQLGEEPFWGALRDIYRNYLFRPVSWSDLRKAFQHHSGQDLAAFFQQWVDRDGAPRLEFKNVTMEKTGAGWEVTGAIEQQPPYFGFQANLQVETDGGRVQRNIPVSGRATTFKIISPDPPVTLRFDPRYNVFRNLHPAEIPPSINALKGTESVLVVVADSAGSGLKQAADTLVASLGLKKARIVPESETETAALEDHDLLWVGRPRRSMLSATITSGLSISDREFSVDGKVFSDPDDVFFGVFARPHSPGRIMALLLPGTEGPLDVVARKVTHYGKYSYLVFRGGRNRLKGVWPVESSPLIIQWPKANNLSYQWNFREPRA